MTLVCPNGSSKVVVIGTFRFGGGAEELLVLLLTSKGASLALHLPLLGEPLMDALHLLHLLHLLLFLLLKKRYIIILLIR